MFKCPHYKDKDKFHKERMEVVSSLVGMRYGKRLANVLDNLIGPTPGMPHQIYEHSLERNCGNGSCFVVKYLPSLISSTAEIIQDELIKSAHVLTPDHASSKRYEMTVEALERLEIIGRYFDAANAYSMAQTEAKEKVRNKLDIYRVASENPKAVNALINFQTETTARLLLEYAPFLSKIYISLLAHKPNHANLLSNLNPETKDYKSQVRDLEELTHSAETSIKQSTKYLMWEMDRKRLTKKDLSAEAVTVLESQVECLKNYSMLQLIRLGALYIEPIRGTFSDIKVSDKKEEDHFASADMNLIYDEMSNTSNAMLNTIYRITDKYFSTLYGAPSSTFCILLGGANARKEFPSFDYDAVATYQKEGKTEGGILGKISNSDYFNMLFTKIMDIANSVGHHFDSNFQDLICYKDGPEDKNTDGSRKIVYSLSAMKEIMYKGNIQTARTAMSTLIIAAGDDDLGEKVMKIGRGLTSTREYVERDLVWNYARRLARREEYEQNTTNVKRSAGGLRDINDAIWMNNALHSRFERNILKGIVQLPLTEGDTGKLMKSYLFMINLRIRMDFYYGRNDKDLPEGEELERFVHAIGYTGDKAVSQFRKRYEMHRKTIDEVAGKAIKNIIADYHTVPEKAVILKQHERDKVDSATAEKRDKAKKNLDAMMEEAQSRISGTVRSPFLSEAWSRRFVEEQGINADE
jgi:hypothetical protein